MPDNDDPFGFGDGDAGGRTVVKPMPGGMPGQFRRPLVDDAKPRERGEPAGYAQNVPWPLTVEGGLNPIERAASSLIALLSKLAGSVDHPDPAALRERVGQEIRVFENNARMAGVSPENLYVARYVLCTAIDEAVLNTPWGAASNWDMQSLLVTFHKEAQGGVRFFQLLKQLSQDPRGNIDLLELMYVLLALGFKGKYRHADDGAMLLDSIREQLYRDIRQQRGDHEQGLSPHWQGVGEGYRPLTHFVPWWVIAAGLGVILLAVYAVLSFRLGDEATPAYDAIAAIATDGLPQRSVRLAPPAPLPPVEPVVVERRLSDDLVDDTAQGVITISEDPFKANIVVRGDGLFRSGSIKVNEGYLPLLERITKALDTFPGKVVVSGHTDDIPIKTLRFPSNWHLSKARADAVLQIMSAASTDPARYESEGRGAREPLVPNDSKANRAQNRRVEITLYKQAGAAGGDA
ncbi:MAG: type IVB secretion system protein IcmH/DotU [Gammaproteobacteria bacterium]|nr:type IVB secretion system protein IcmH/DotU [Gammaproteobacteria bacterium]MCB1923886.1 type IVB secretion system protein IcmH/DotU [Gammaproteobacteria bacterium]